MIPGGSFCLARDFCYFLVGFHSCLEAGGNSAHENAFLETLQGARTVCATPSYTQKTCLFPTPSTILTDLALEHAVRGHLGPRHMYSMNWETCSFMRMRHVLVHETLSRGQFVATVHFMQRCRLPRLCRAHQIQTKRGEIKREDIIQARREKARGLVPGRSVEKHTFPVGQEGGLLISRPNIFPTNGGPIELDGMMESLPHLGPSEFYSADIPPDVGA